MSNAKMMSLETVREELRQRFPQAKICGVDCNVPNVLYVDTDDTMDESTLYDAIYRHDTACKAKYDVTSNAKFSKDTEDNKMDNKIDELLNIVNAHRCKIEELYDDDAKAQIKRVRIKNKIWIELEKFVETYDKLLTEHNHAMANANEYLMNFLWDDVFYTDDERKKIDVIKGATQVRLQTFRENMDTIGRLIKAADTFAERYQILRSYGITDALCKCDCQG